ncbi:MAG: DUF72 domain-containing protein [Candidatus Aenigmarchaeota archaeon]|nr:DUF72 domain-containing protein [Candidatus Aenigmarchaeota archaeon]
MKIFIGTSGWAYSWNLGGNLSWYVNNSKLNAIELNASFYRFPFPNQIKSWSKIGKILHWCIKVNRFITHVYKFNEKAINVWNKFQKIFEPLENHIDFYLFQLPPSFSEKQKNKISKFLNKIKLEQKIALEARNTEWWNKDVYDWAKTNNICFVSVSAPKLPDEIIKTSDSVYLRLHGKESWYSYCYTKEELKEISRKIKAIKPKRAYIFFNNDHDMLENARLMKKYLNRKFY